MRKILLFAFFSLFLLFEGNAKPRTQSEAQNVADSFLRKSSPLKFTNKGQSLTLAYAAKEKTVLRSATDNARFYIFNIGNSDGFVIVSGDDRAKDILGYADNGAFDIDDISPAFASWLSFYQDEIEKLSETAETGNAEEYIYVDKSDKKNFATSVSPLLKAIKWNQGAPYNDMCPIIPEGKANAGVQTVTGCVATAMAQVMMYHKWPVKGKGSRTYTPAFLGVAQSVKFSDHTYNWSLMSDSYSSASTQAQKNEVAKLMYHCGVSVDMDYNTESGAFTKDVATSLHTYFDYDKNTQYYMRDFYSHSEWVSLIKTELNAARPVIFSGQSSAGGHAFVCDGYDKNNFYHFNWGWGGVSDGYFELSALNPSTLGIGAGSGGYNTSQGIIVGIQKPNASSTPHPSQFLSNAPMSVSSVSVSRSSVFTATLNQIFNFGVSTLSVRFGFGLYDGNGELKYRKNSDSYTFAPYYGFNTYEFPMTLPATVSTGNYKLYPICSEDGVNWAPIRGRIGTTQYMDVVVTSSTISFGTTTNVAPQLLLGKFGAVASVFQNRQADFTAEVKNSGKAEYNSDIVLVLNNQAISIEPVVILPGETKTVNFSTSISLEPGTYTLRVAYDENNNRSSFQSATLFDGSLSVVVNAEPAEADLMLLEEISIPNPNKVYQHDIQLTAKVKNSGGYYRDYVVAHVFDQATGSYATSFGNQIATIEGGETKTLVLKGDLNVPAGDYIIALFGSGEQLKEYGDSWIICTLLERGASVDAQNVNSTDLRIYPNPTSDFINFDSEDVVKSVTVFDMLGKQVLVSQPNANGKVSISVSHLPAGTYIVKKETENAVKTDRFIKK